MNIKVSKNYTKQLDEINFSNKWNDVTELISDLERWVYYLETYPREEPLKRTHTLINKLCISLNKLNRDLESVENRLIK